MQQRFARATAVAWKLARLGISLEAKLRTIEANILPMAMYGVELANPPEDALRKLCTAVLACMTKNQTNKKRGAYLRS